MTSWVNGLTDAQEERLTLLAEEAAEVIQIVMKIKRFGFYSTCGGSHAPNIELLHGELGDLQAIVKLMEVQVELDGDILKEAVIDKLQRMGKFTQYQEPSIARALGELL